MGTTTAGTFPAARSAAYWRARADEHRDYLQFRLPPETEEYHRQEALFCDGCAEAAERGEGKASRGGGPFQSHGFPV